MEKKCVNCQNMDFCVLYLKFVEMAGLLNTNLNPDIAGDKGFVFMVNHLAHDCKRYRPFEK